MQGVQLDASSAGALHESLQALKHHEDADLIEIMQLLVTKPMQVHLCAAWRAHIHHCSAEIQSSAHIPATSLPSVLQLLLTHLDSTRHARHDMLQNICGHAESLSYVGVWIGKWRSSLLQPRAAVNLYTMSDASAARFTLELLNSLICRWQDISAQGT